MGSKCGMNIKKIIVLIICIILMIVVLVISNRKEDYVSDLISIFNKKQKITVGEVFSFDFEKAYVIDDCYITGEGFSERYNLELSIDQVKPGTSENIQRIVFVDEQGDFVYEFKCDFNQIVWDKQPVIIYPETIIERKSFDEKMPLKINFRNVGYYD